MAKRKHADEHWQFPQGGIDQGESPLLAVFREMKEELGTRNFKVIEQSNEKYRYRWPTDLSVQRGAVGQEQTYFLLRFLGEKHEITPDEREFEDITWVPWEQVLAKAAEVRRPLYEKVLAEFSPFV